MQTFFMRDAQTTIKIWSYQCQIAGKSCKVNVNVNADVWRPL